MLNLMSSDLANRCPASGRFVKPQPKNMVYELFLSSITDDERKALESELTLGCPNVNTSLCVDYPVINY